MLSVAEAQAIVLEHAAPPPPAVVPLAETALGLVLAEDVASDMDMPPYDKALMDGYAVRSADLSQGHGVLTITEEITAGRMPTLPVRPGQAARIMTGAPLPEGADAVVMVERTRLLEDDHVQIDDKPPHPGQNVLRQASEMRRGDTVLSRGTVLRPQEIGVLATVGRTSIQVFPRPQVAILATGDELVEAGRLPAPGQIRNGNSPMLTAQVCRAGGVPRNLGIAPDEMPTLKALIAEGLRSSMLVLSGGVSAGKLDLVPAALQDLGVKAHVHKIAMKPGKPILFGTKIVSPLPGGEGPGRRGQTLVFGLPGNPVSALVCFELFVRPAIRRLAGHAEPGPFLRPARLMQDFAYRSDRPTYHPARLELQDGSWLVQPVAWLGSADLRSVTRANTFVLLPQGEHVHKAGTVFPVLLTD